MKCRFQLFFVAPSVFTSARLVCNFYSRCSISHCHKQLVIRLLIVHWLKCPAVPWLAPQQLNESSRCAPVWWKAWVWFCHCVQTQGTILPGVLPKQSLKLSNRDVLSFHQALHASAKSTYNITILSVCSPAKISLYGCFLGWFSSPEMCCSSRHTNGMRGIAVVSICSSQCAPKRNQRVFNPCTRLGLDGSLLSSILLTMF